MWLYFWALMESWLMAVDGVGRYAGSWSYIQGSTCNHENEGKTNNLRWMLYSVYAVLGLCLYSVYACTRCMLYSVYAVLGVCCTRCMLVLGVCCTWCELMIMTWRDRERWLDFVFCNDGRVVDEKERDRRWRWERCGGDEWIWEIKGVTCLIGLGRPHIGVITWWIGTRTCCIGDGQLTRTRNSVKSQFLMMISPITSHVPLSRPQLYHQLRTRS